MTFLKLFDFGHSCREGHFGVLREEAEEGLDLGFGRHGGRSSDLKNLTMALSKVSMGFAVKIFTQMTIAKRQKLMILAYY